MNFPNCTAFEVRLIIITFSKCFIYTITNFFLFSPHYLCIVFQESKYILEFKVRKRSCLPEKIIVTYFEHSFLYLNGFVSDSKAATPEINLLVTFFALHFFPNPIVYS